MKTILFATSLLLSLFFQEVFAAPLPDNPSVEAAFSARFAAAREAQWTQVNGLYRVHFELDGLVSNAYFSPEGSLVALTRQVSPEALPTALRSRLQPSLRQRWISDLFVVETEAGSTYYASLRGADDTVLLQSVAGRCWTHYRATAAL